MAQEVWDMLQRYEREDVEEAETFSDERRAALRFRRYEVPDDVSPAEHFNTVSRHLVTDEMYALFHRVMGALPYDQRPALPHE